MTLNDQRVKKSATHGVYGPHEVDDYDDDDDDDDDDQHTILI